LGFGFAVGVYCRVDANVCFDDGGRVNGHAFKIMWVAVGMCVVVVVASMLATVFYSRHLSDDRRAEQVAGCERANVLRGYINTILLHHPTLGLPAVPIIDCEAIIK
jgi:heme exporter protein D